MGHHLAQFNIGKLRPSLDAASVKAFTSAISDINRIAERSPGFLWRLPDEDAHAVEAGGGDAGGYLVNLSLWVDYRSLHDFVYRSPHGRFTRHRRRWFEAPDGPAFVLWWTRAGCRPTVDEAQARLTHLRRHGPTAAAFSVRRRFDPAGRHVATR